jgi:hypothetical protein
MGVAVHLDNAILDQLTVDSFGATGNDNDITRSENLTEIRDNLKQSTAPGTAAATAANGGFHGVISSGTGITPAANGGTAAAITAAANDNVVVTAKNAVDTKELAKGAKYGNIFENA